MNYDIKIKDDSHHNGLLEFERLGLITQITKEIATKALMLKMTGYSDIKPENSIKRALAIRLQQLASDATEGTSLLLDCDNFETTIKSLQLDAFRPTEDLLKLTPMALVIQTFRSAILDEEDKANLDKPLLKTLLKFKKNFISDKEVFYFSNRSSIPAIEVSKNDFEKIALLDDSFPEPKKTIINGQLDEIKISKNKLGLVTQDGMVPIFANQKVILEGIIEFIGKEVTISGMAHFKPNGQLSFIEMQEYFRPGEKDSFYSKKPTSMNADQQLLFQIKQGKKRNPLSDITGKWPGDESFDDLMKMLE